MYIYEKQCNKIKIQIKIQRQVKSTKSGNKRGGGGRMVFQNLCICDIYPNILEISFCQVIFNYQKIYWPRSLHSPDTETREEH